VYLNYANILILIEYFCIPNGTSIISFTMIKCRIDCQDTRKMIFYHGLKNFM